MTIYLDPAWVERSCQGEYFRLSIIALCLHDYEQAVATLSLIICYFKIELY